MNWRQRLLDPYRWRDYVPAPNLVDGAKIPLCSKSCPAYDGEHCRMLGLRPRQLEICEPVVDEMANELDAFERDTRILLDSLL
jgi:hypothetical protein